MSVTKNGEKIEFTRDTDGKLTGINRKICNDIKFFYDEDGKLFRTKINDVNGDKIYKEFYKGTNKVKYKYCKSSVNGRDYVLHIYDQKGKLIREVYMSGSGFGTEKDGVNFFIRGAYTVQDRQKTSGYVIEDGIEYRYDNKAKWETAEDNHKIKFNHFNVDINYGKTEVILIKKVDCPNGGKRYLNPSKVITTVEHPEYGSFDIVYDSGTKKIDFLDQKNKPDSEEVAKIIIDKAKSNFQQAYEFVRKLPKYAQEWDNDFMKWVLGKK